MTFNFVKQQTVVRMSVVDFTRRLPATADFHFILRTRSAENLKVIKVILE